MLDKLFVLFLVVMCHVFNVCIVGFCMAGLSTNEPPTYGSTIAVLAATILAIQYLALQPYFHIRELPPLLRCFYKILVILLAANVFFHIIWLPLITFLGVACEDIGNTLRQVPGCKNILEMNVLGMEALEIITALLLLYHALTTTGIIDSIMCMVMGPKRRTPCRACRVRR